METIVHGYLSSSYCWYAAVAVASADLTTTTAVAVAATTAVAANCLKD